MTDPIEKDSPIKTRKSFSLTKFRAISCDFSFFVFCRSNDIHVITDPNQPMPTAVSDLGLDCLPLTEEQIMCIFDI